MKYSKAAAIVAGSLVALGAASVVSTAQAAEPVPGGGLSGGRDSRATTSAPNMSSDPISSLTGQKLGPISKVAQQAGSVLGKASSQGGKPLGMGG